jgi:predicted NAD/FAD-dependent oxidoreductase
MTDLAIVGAGLAGLSAAWALRDDPVAVTIFEKSRGVSGRAATRGRNGVRYDHGANYFTPTSRRVRRLVTRHLPTEPLVDIDRPVGTFDRDGSAGVPDASNERPKWTYRDGISRLGKLLAAASSAEIQHQVRVDRLLREPGATAGWRLRDVEGGSYASFDAVLLTPPAPQTATILRSSEMPATLRATLVDGMQAAAYVPQFAYIFAVEDDLSRPVDAYGLRASDPASPVAWIGFENDKPGHVPNGITLIVVQTSPHWTADRVDAAPADFLPVVRSKVEALVGTDLPPFAWTDTQRWRYALPTAPADAEALAEGEAAGLFFAGDALAGKGRIGRAIESGLDAADRIRAAFSAR